MDNGYISFILSVRYKEVLKYYTIIPFNIILDKNNQVMFINTCRNAFYHSRDPRQLQLNIKYNSFSCYLAKVIKSL